MIHPTAIIDPSASLDSTVAIGPYSVIGSNVEIGANTRIGPQCVITGPTTIGADNHIYQFCSIGEDPQDKKFAGDANSRLVIGDRNVVREYCTINRGTDMGGGVTKLGNDNWIMAYVHIAHDCIIGDNNTFANNTTFAGHVLVENHVTFGGFTGIHQFCRVGSYCFSAISSIIVKDVPPFLMITGNTARPCGLNREGLKRHGFSSERINELRRVYRTLYRDGLMLNEAIDRITDMANSNPDIEYFINFIKESQRGIIR